MPAPKANPTSLLFASASSQYVTVADNASLKPTGNFTAEFFIKTSSNSGNVLQSYSRNTNLAGWYFDFTASGYPRLISGRNTGSTQGTDFQIATGSNNVCDGHWHHVAGVWDGSTLYVYVDYVLSGSTAWAFAPGYATSNYIVIGAYEDNGSVTVNFNGNLNNLRLWNVARTASQIADRTADVTGATGLVAWWRCKDTAGTTLTDVVGGFNGTLINSPTWAIDVPFTVHESTANSNSFVNTRLDTDGSIQSYFSMDGNSTDSIGGHNGTDSNMTYPSSGMKYGSNYASFNGTNSQINLGNVNDPGANSFSVAFWINMGGSNTRDHGIIDKFATNTGYQIAVASASNEIYFLGEAGGTTLWNIDNTPVGTGSWHHVVCVANRTNSNATIYVDGVAVATASISAATSIANSNPIRMGVDWANTSFTSMGLDDVEFFSRVFSDADVMDLYIGKKVNPVALGSTTLGSDANLQAYWRQENNWNDSSPHGYALTPQSSPTFTTGKFGQGGNFNGTSYANIPAASSPNLPRGNSSLSYAFWINPNATPNVQVGILGMSNTGTNFRCFHFAGSTQQVKFLWDSVSIIGSAIINASSWHFIVGILDTTRSTIAIYIDGVYQFTAITNPTGTNTSDFYLGQIPGIAATNSILDDVSVFNRALTPDEMALIFYGGGNVATIFHSLMLMGIGS